MKIIFLLFTILTLVATPAYPDDLQKGIDARNRGNYEAALKIIKPLADAGHAIAQYTLGLMYQNKQGVNQNYLKAAKLHRFASEQGNTNAQYALGLLYQNGQGVNQDSLEAIKLFLKSAKHGNLRAKALREKNSYHKWVILAGEQGNIYAQIFLGEKYYLGLNVVQSYTESANWYKKAADQGSATAQNILGAMNEKGKGVAKDYVKAHKWFTLSEKNKNSFGRAYRINIEKRMNPDQITKAQELAKTWLDKH